MRGGRAYLEDERGWVCYARYGHVPSRSGSGWIDRKVEEKGTVCRSGDRGDCEGVLEE